MKMTSSTSVYRYIHTRLQTKKLVKLQQNSSLPESGATRQLY
ncbi:hypothetical protein DSUL_20420 [Desulfovibrionales bacterium]